MHRCDHLVSDRIGVDGTGKLDCLIGREIELDTTDLDKPIHNL